MGSINKRDGKLFFDFRYRGARCREYTRLGDTPTNRKQMESILERIEAEILLDSLNYRAYFKNSPLADRFEAIESQLQEEPDSDIPEFARFANLWFDEMKPEWRNSYINNIRLTLDRYVIPALKGKKVTDISKADILAFRTTLTEPDHQRKQPLAASRINHIMTPLRMILNEAADRYNFPTPYRKIKPLKVPRSDVNPFTLEEVRKIMEEAPAPYENYYSLRLLTGLRTAEIDGLQWQYLDLERAQLQVCKTVVDGEIENTKTDGSYRTVDLTPRAVKALKAQHKRTGKHQFVFCNTDGRPFSHRRITRQVWYPLLERLKFAKRRPYQTRHTTATLWLGAGENPEWIARQLGHSTEMLFKIYSRWVPNLTRRDGSAAEALIESVFTDNSE